MAAISTIIAGVGLGLGVAGTAMQYKGSKDAEEAQKRSANLQAQRDRREVVRRGMLARSQALTAGSQMGSGLSSSLQGGLGSIGSQTAYGVQGVNQGQQLGNQISNANAMSNLGGVISSLGGAAVSNSGTLGRVGTYIQNKI